jgi:hypothetical protein
MSVGFLVYSGMGKSDSSRRATRCTIPIMEPVTTVTTAWTIAKTAGEVSNKLYDFMKSLKDHESKQRVDEIIDRLRELKKSASELEDENRELREKLRFKSDEYEFRTPFYYHKASPEQPLCAKCYATSKAAPMSQPYRAADGLYCRCLVCDNLVRLDRNPSSLGAARSSGPHSWMRR